MNTQEIKAAIRSSQVVQFTRLQAPMNGARCIIKRQSKKTDDLTVEMVEDIPGTKILKGDLVHVHAYEIEAKELRPAEKLEELQSLRRHVHDYLNRLIKQGEDARREFASRILIDTSTPQDEIPLSDRVVELLVNKVRWGHGVAEDLRASHAAKIKYLLSKHEDTQITSVLTAYGKELEESLINNRYQPNSTSMFSNAVENVRAEIASEFVSWCRRTIFRLESLTKEVSNGNS